MTSSAIHKNRNSVRKYVGTKRGHIGKLMATAKRRAKEKGLDFDLDLDYLEQIAVDECPVFKIKFTWGRNQGRKDIQEKPSLDRIIPSLGYVKHNVAFISVKANAIKQDVEEKELYAVADWLHEARKEVLKNVKQKSTPSVPTNNHQQGEEHFEHWAVSGARVGEDNDSADDYRRATRGENAYHSAKEGSGNSVGTRDKEMGAFKTSYSSQMYGDTNPALKLALEFNRYSNNQLRECCLVDGTEPEISKSGD